MTAAEDFLSVDPIQRDRWGRALIAHSETGEVVPFTRASTLGGFLSDHSGLHKWQMANLAKGLSVRPDLCAALAGLEPLDGTRKHDDPIKREQRGYIELAEEIGGAHEKANWGTAAHTFCMPGNTQPVPEKIKADVESFRRLNLDIVMSERFVVNEKFMAAGSFDHIVNLPDLGHVVLDIKTGGLKPQDVAVQLAIYAGGTLCDPATSQREPWPFEVNQDVAILAHIPHGEGRTDLYLIDLAEGRKAAQVAAWTREWRARKDLMTTYTVAASFVPPWLVAS